jgi:hypothetical protein
VTPAELDATTDRLASLLGAEPATVAIAAFLDGRAQGLVESTRAIDELPQEHIAGELQRRLTKAGAHLKSGRAS